jgi:ATP-dependent protease ClpP protease subunit
MEYYIIFAGIIEKNFCNQLVAAINEAQQLKASKIIILFSSIGGNVQEGFTLASVIQNSVVPIQIHATNNIDSIANVIYLSAKSYAKFYLHGARVEANFDEKALKENLQSVRAETARIAQFVSENTQIPFKRVRSMMTAGTTLTSQEALGFGIVGAITHKIVPLGAIRKEILVVN